MLKCLYRDPTNKRCDNNATNGGYCWIHYSDLPTTIRFAPSISLNYLTLAINDFQSKNLSELVSINKEMQSNSDIISNKAEFKPLKLDQNPVELILMEVENESQRNLIIMEQNATGKEFLFQSSVFIQGKATNILAFKKND